MNEGAPVLMELYVFSGPHLGARVELGEGRWILGSDDASDLILTGLESRHAVLEVSSGAGGAPAVTLAPLDGPVRLHDGEAVPPSGAGPAAALAPQAGEAWYLGLTCFAWNLPGVTQPVIMPEAGRTEPAPVPDPEPQAQDAPETPQVGEAPAPQEGNSVGAAQPLLPEILPDTPAVPHRRGGALRRVLLLLLLAGALTAMSVALTPDSADERDYPRLIKQYLDDAGIRGLSVTARYPGVEVRGAVEDDAAMLRLRDMARALHIPVYLEVAVRDDVIRAVRSSLGIRGFYPRVTLEETAGGVSRLKVAAYMKDELLQKSAFTALAGEVKRLPPVEPAIVHERELAPVLQEALNQAGFSAIRAVYLPGRVDFAGDIRPGDAEKLDAIRTAVGDRLGIDLHGVSRSASVVDPRRPLAAEPLREIAEGPETGIAAPAAPGRGDPLGGLRVTGVTMSPMRFVTTADGRRLFEGAVLPGGWTLESIDTRVLVFRRGEQIVSHRLRGN